MITVDRIRIHAPPERIFSVARDVEQWPRILPHYRWVRFLEHAPSGGGIVEMAAWRPFGVLRYPTWWVSRMTIDARELTISYTHIRGITRGMDVRWSLAPHNGATDVSIEHRWSGPGWPGGGAFASAVVGPVFIHGIASRTLRGIKQAAEGGGRRE
jgi:ribosome-associated toxin RatA of RatAB toxin-antitoxin module